MVKSLFNKKQLGGKSFPKEVGTQIKHHPNHGLFEKKTTPHLSRCQMTRHLGIQKWPSQRPTDRHILSILCSWLAKNPPKSPQQKHIRHHKTHKSRRNGLYLVYVGRRHSSSRVLSLTQTSGARPRCHQYLAFFFSKSQAMNKNHLQKALINFWKNCLLCFTFSPAGVPRWVESC